VQPAIGSAAYVGGFCLPWFVRCLRKGRRAGGRLDRILAGLGALALAVAGLVPQAAAAPSSAAAPSLGVWLTTVDSPVLHRPDQALQASRWLAEQGFRRVGVPLYTDGQLLWNVPADRNRLGIPRSTATLADPDLRQLLLDLRHRGLQTVGWLEYGLMAPQAAPWLRGRERLLLQDRQGRSQWQEFGGDRRVWLNPIAPEVRHLLVDLVVDACTRLPLDVIQLDDHFAWPVELGYDPLTLESWRRSRWGRFDPTPNPDAPAWVSWRSDRLTALLAQIRTAMSQRCPGVRLSLSPQPQPISSQLFLADWPHWVRRRLVDELVVQLYRDRPTDVEEALGDPSLQEASARVPLRIALLAGLRTQPKTSSILRRELELVRARGYGGIDLFFYETMRNKSEAWAFP